MTAKTSAAEDIVEQVMSAATGRRTYEIVTTQGKIRVSIPENHRITYGPVSPGGKYGGGEMALRVYEDATHQRMLVTGVQSFRDMTLPVMRAVVRKRGTKKWLPDNPTTMMQALRGEKSSDLERDWINEAEFEIDPDLSEVPEDPWGAATATYAPKFARSSR